MLSFSAAAFAQIGIGISVSFGPPPIPIYEQPPCPGAGYFWTPGYWSWSDDDGYYWVPGTWVVAPVGMYWTPGYWGWNDGAYVWNDGYWGPHVGYYGGINYGFGYTGDGYYGGEWRGRSFYYNREVENVRNTHITNVYNRTVVVNNRSHVSYNGGEGGVAARPNQEQERFAHEHHVAAIAAQRQQMRDASHNRALFARENNGRPAIAATARPGDFKTHVVAAKEAGGAYHPPAISPREARVKPGENKQAERNQPARGQEQRGAEQNRKAEANRNAEKRTAWKITRTLSVRPSSGKTSRETLSASRPKRKSSNSRRRRLSSGRLGNSRKLSSSASRPSSGKTSKRTLSASWPKRKSSNNSLRRLNSGRLSNSRRLSSSASRPSSVRTSKRTLSASRPKRKSSSNSLKRLNSGRLSNSRRPNNASKGKRKRNRNLAAGSLTKGRAVNRNAYL